MNGVSGNEKAAAFYGHEQERRPQLVAARSKKNKNFSGKKKEFRGKGG